jgi:hypothetical protein
VPFGLPSRTSKSVHGVVWRTTISHGFRNSSPSDMRRRIAQSPKRQRARQLGGHPTQTKANDRCACRRLACLGTRPSSGSARPFPYRSPGRSDRPPRRLLAQLPRLSADILQLWIPRPANGLTSKYFQSDESLRQPAAARRTSWDGESNSLERLCLTRPRASVERFAAPRGRTTGRRMSAVRYRRRRSRSPRARAANHTLGREGRSIFSDPSRLRCSDERQRRSLIHHNAARCAARPQPRCGSCSGSS